MLFVPSLRPVFFLFFNVVAICWLGVSLDRTMPKSRRLAIMYLFCVGLFYFAAGIAGSSPVRSTSSVAYFLLADSAVFPAAALVHAITSHANSYPGSLYEVTENLHLLSVVVTYCGVAAIAAAVAMTKKLKIGYFVWLGLTTVSSFASPVVFGHGCASTSGSHRQSVLGVHLDNVVCLGYWAARSGADVGPRVVAGT